LSARSALGAQHFLRGSDVTAVRESSPCDSAPASSCEYRFVIASATRGFAYRSRVTPPATVIGKDHAKDTAAAARGSYTSSAIALHTARAMNSLQTAPTSIHRLPVDA
jgi:hypothetical protein